MGVFRQLASSDFEKEILRRVAGGGIPGSLGFTTDRVAWADSAPGSQAADSHAEDSAQSTVPRMCPRSIDGPGLVDLAGRNVSPPVPPLRFLHALFSCE